jgi:hypothetical protein
MRRAAQAAKGKLQLPSNQSLENGRFGTSERILTTAPLFHLLLQPNLPRYEFI